MDKEWPQDTLDGMPTMYGIWIYAANTWMQSADGLIFHTANIYTAMAQLEDSVFDSETAEILEFGEPGPVKLKAT